MAGSAAFRPGRRSFISALLTTPAFAAKNPACEEMRLPSGWCAESFMGRTVYYRGEGPAIILLHEINGLSPGCIDFGVELVDAGFRVFMPLLFGHPAQDNAVSGYFEACWGSFACGAVDKDMKIAGWLQEFVAHVGEGGPEGKGMGVIGMCLTGALPLNVMANPKVRAVVMSQPALPFGGLEQQGSAGVSKATMEAARESGTPILAFRFKDDTISTGTRFSFLDQYFGLQFSGMQIDTPHGFHPDLTHRLHAVLTGPFGEEKKRARKAVIEFMRKRLV